MSKKIAVAFIILISFPVMLICETQNAQIVINNNDPNPHKLNRLLFGGFLEMLNDYVNGPLGLWHQELRDRGMDWDDKDYNGISDLWFPLYPDAIYEQIEGGYNENGRFSQKISNSDNSTMAGIAQETFVSDTVSHEFYIYLKGDIAAESKVLLRLYDVGAKSPYFEHELIKPESIWEKDSVSIPAFKNMNNIYLAIELHGKGSIELDEASLTPSNSIDGFRKEYYDLIKDCRLSILRYPGGWFADNPDNNWKLGIGDIDRRKASLSDGIRHPQRLDFGTDEYMKTCSNLNIEPHFVVNYTRNDPQEAADWVEYLNGSEHSEFGSLRASNGNAEPYGVEFFEIGNEQWGYEYEMTKRYLQYYDAMYAKDNSLSIMVDGNLWRGMNNFDIIMGEIGKKCQIFSWHITQVGNAKSPSTNDNIFKIMVGSSHNHIQNLSNYQNALIYNDLYPDVKQGCTEWWTEYESQVGSIMDTSMRSGSLEVGLCDAGYLQTYMMFPQTMILAERTFGLTFLKSGIDSITKKKSIFGSPSYHSFSMLSNHSGDMLLPSEVKCNKFSTEPVEGLYTLQNVPYIQSVTTMSEDTIFVSILNRSPVDTILVNLTFDKNVVHNNCKVYELYSYHYLDANTPEEPLKITPYSYNWEYSGTFPIKPHCFSIIAMPIDHNIDIPQLPQLKNTKIYPNPFNNKLYLELGGIDTVIDDIKICDILGKEVDCKISVLSSSLIEISTEDIHDGIYFVNVLSGKSTETFKVYSFRK